MRYVTLLVPFATYLYIVCTLYTLTVTTRVGKVHKKYWNKLEWCMTLGHSKTTEIFVSTVHTTLEMCSRDTEILFVVLWFNVVHYSSLFQYFFKKSSMVPTLVL